MSVNGASVIASIVGLLLCSIVRGVPAAQTADGAATSVLKRARQWAGETALANVQSISVAWQREEVRVREQWRVRWPDQFQTRYSLGGVPFSAATPADLGANTLDGGNFWQKFRTPVSPENAARAKRGSLSVFTKVSLIYLLRLPTRPEVAARALGRRSILGLEGDAILITDPNRLFHVFVFDANTGALLGYVWNTKADGGLNRPTDHRVERFSDFREISGIKFPFRIEETWDASVGTQPQVTTCAVELIEVNTLKASDFKQPK